MIIPILIVIGIIICIFIFKGPSNIQMIELETSKNGLYEWECEIENKKIVKLNEKKRIGEQNDQKNNGPVIDKYYFKSLKPGKTTIKFTYTNTKNGSYGEIKRYKVTVDKNLKLKIVESK